MSKYSLRTVRGTLTPAMVVVAIASALAACGDRNSSVATEVETDPAAVAALVAITPPTSPGWHAEARDIVSTGRLSPLAAGRIYAALSVAQYRAVVQADTLVGNGTNPAGRAAREAQRGAIAGASAVVLSFFSADKAAAFESRVTTEGSVNPGAVHPQYTRGVALGRVVGEAMVNRLRNDKFTTPFTGTIPTGPDIWITTGVPAGATLSGMTPYLLTSASQFRAPAPPVFGSPTLLAAVAEIKSIEQARTSQQVTIANYWNFPGGTYTPIGYWDEIVGKYIDADKLSERAATRAFALTNVAMMDALIACWESKYFYLVRRPTQLDNTISLVFALPNHPSYPSGHSCSSAAAATVLSSLFPTRSSELAGWVTEAGLSRKYAGIHFQFDVTAGENLGNNVGRYTLQREAQVGLLGAIQ